MSSKKHIVDVDDLIGKVYFKIATWHNNEEELTPQEMQNRLVSISKEVIELTLSSFFEDGTFANEQTEAKVVKTEAKTAKTEAKEEPKGLEGLNIDLSRFKGNS